MKKGKVYVHLESIHWKTPATMDMEATMEITFTVGNAVAIVGVFGQYLSRKNANSMQHSNNKKEGPSLFRRL